MFPARQLIVSLAAASTFAAAAAVAAPIHRAAEPIEGQYLVVLRDEAVRPKEAGLHDARPTVEELSNELAGRGRLTRQYRAALRGFALEADRAAAEQLAADPRVAYVAEDGRVGLSGQTAPPSWGLDRIDQRPAALDGYYEYFADGAVIDVFVIDTGIRSTHSDFQGRVDLGTSFTAIADGFGTEDCHGHGTHVAGIVGGFTYGVAKAVTLHPVRVLDCSGGGSISSIVAGVDYVTGLYYVTTTTSGGKGGGKNSSPPASAVSTAPAVVNMSVATVGTKVIDDAVARSIAAGLTYVVAAGNASADACSYSPSRVAGAITVASSARIDAPSASSNHGACVDLYAPGEAIVSSYYRSDDDVTTMTGTSMASPHVAGAAALLLSVNPSLTPTEVATLLQAAATRDALTGVRTDTPNLLLFAPFTGYGADMAPVAEFTAVCASGTCKFNAAAAVDDRGLIDFRWDFGNGRSGSGESTSYKYGRSAPSEVTVTLTVTDTAGQTTSVEKLVRPAGN